jgi:hypothetical protein
MQTSRSRVRCFGALGAAVLLASAHAAETPKKPAPTAPKPVAAPPAPHPAATGAAPTHTATPTAGAPTTHGPLAGGGEHHITTTHVPTSVTKGSKDEPGSAKDGPLSAAIDPSRRMHHCGSIPS